MKKSYYAMALPKEVKEQSRRLRMRQKYSKCCILQQNKVALARQGFSIPRLYYMPERVHLYFREGDFVV